MGNLLHLLCIVFAVNVLCSIAQAQDTVTDSDISVVPLPGHDLAVTNVEEDYAYDQLEDFDHYEDSVRDGFDEFDVYGDSVAKDEEKDIRDTDNTVSPRQIELLTRLGNFTGRVITTEINVTLDVDEFTTISSENYPSPYPTRESIIYEWFVGLGEGYGIEMIIKSMDLANNDYLIVMPGGAESSSERQLVFSNMLSDEKKYKLFHLDEMYFAFVVNMAATNTHQGFQVDFKKVGIRPTTEIPTTTEEQPVTVAPMNESTIYLGGLTPLDFLSSSDQFKLQLASVAEFYCTQNNISIDENLTISDNVNYHKITQCNLQWPDSSKCIEIFYSIGVSYNNVTDEYELTAQHLDDMWLTLRTTFNLTTLGLYAYDPPNNEHVVMVWLIISCVIIAMFVLVILISMKYNCFKEYTGRESMRTSLMSQKLTNSSLFPTPHQTVPPFYGMDYYSPEDDQFWAKDEDLPPKYSGMSGQRNEGFIPDDEILDLYSEEIVMSLPDGKDQIQFRLKNSDNKYETGESVM